MPKEIYILLANADRNEGRGPRYPVAACLYKEEAEQIITSKQWAKEYGIMGQPEDCPNRAIAKLKIISSANEI